MAGQNNTTLNIDGGVSSWSRFRMTPQFVIIGVQKGGTTSLYHLLCQHPSIEPAARKEVHYFDIEYHRGRRWYQSQFPSALSQFVSRHLQRMNTITGEASPYYMFHPYAMQRLAHDLPGTKLIVLLRNPVERAYSHYHHEVKLKVETLSFEEAIAKEEERLGGEIAKMLKDQQYQSFNHRHFSYLSRGVYVDQLNTVFKLFSRNQILILKSEDFFTRTADVLEETCSFLQLTPRQSSGFDRLNEGRYSKMKPEMQEFLRAYFAPHNQRLYECLGRDFGW
jgi:hypothetical protein